VLEDDLAWACAFDEPVDGVAVASGVAVAARVVVDEEVVCVVTWVVAAARAEVSLLPLPVPGVSRLSRGRKPRTLTEAIAERR
jgi:hypothetical protein